MFQTCFASSGRIDQDAVAAHMHGPALPDKRKESDRFMQPLLGEIVSTIESNVPARTITATQTAESAELAKAKRPRQSEFGWTTSAHIKR